MELAELAERDLWNRIATDGDEAARNRLFLAYSPWAAAVARDIHRRVWAYPVDCEDFIQNATIGLIEAMSRFEPDRGVPFRAFARSRVRGAVFNGLRAILGDRLKPAEETRFSARLESLQNDSQENPFDTVVNSIVGLGVAFLLEDAAHAATWQQQTDALEYVQRSQTQSLVVAAIDHLPGRLKDLVRKHYFQFVPFHEIALEWGVTKGRISQLHRAALEKLRQLLRNFSNI